MIPRGIGLWLPSALLLSWVPGSVPLHGPCSVTVTVGDSLSMTCQYEERFKMNKKLWCRVSPFLLCEEIVKTGGSEEARNGRVSIRDDRDNLTFTVTLQSLTLEDADTYMCVVDIPLIDHSLGIDKSFKVELSLLPGSSLWRSTNFPEPTISSRVYTQPSVTTEESFRITHFQPRAYLTRQILAERPNMSMRYNGSTATDHHQYL
ncbi:CMRF-35-like molecule 4 [Rattus rattus]|uniref:CMRF-35-like molecule 4 n=1 Tax=Rattus rattus TaxID=10117 RepID=UPI0013F3439D|nr:CMRF-35-like molecule 4 [Rattus rattus]